MIEKDLLSFLEDIVEQDSDLGTLKYRHTTYGYGKYNLDILKQIAIYGLQYNLFKLSKYVNNEKKYYDIDLAESVKIIEKDKSWENGDDEVYYITFIDIPHYFFIIFGPYGPVGENAFEGAKIPDEFAKFIIE